MSRIKLWWAVSQKWEQISRFSNKCHLQDCLQNWRLCKNTKNRDFNRNLLLDFHHSIIGWCNFCLATFQIEIKENLLPSKKSTRGPYSVVAKGNKTLDAIQINWQISRSCLLIRISVASGWLYFVYIFFKKKKKKKGSLWIVVNNIISEYWGKILMKRHTIFRLNNLVTCFMFFFRTDCA